MQKILDVFGVDLGPFVGVLCLSKRNEGAFVSNTQRRFLGAARLRSRRVFDSQNRHENFSETACFVACFRA